MKKSVRQLVTASLLAALVCVVTTFVSVPSPVFNGNMNLGDGFVLLAGWLLSPVYGFAAAGIGSALADVFAGYAVYAPATFLIKGLTALCAGLLFSFLKKHFGNLPSRIISGFLAELIVVFGYYLYEGILYGFAPSLVNIPVNATQAFAGLLTGLIVIKATEKIKIKM